MFAWEIFQLKPFLSHRYHCKYVNNLCYVCGNILTCRSLAFFRFNPSHNATQTHRMETFGDNWNGLTWFRFKIWQQNESDLFASFGCFFLPICVRYFKAHRVLSPNLSEWHLNKNKRQQKWESGKNEPNKMCSNRKNQLSVLVIDIFYSFQI